MAESQTTLPVVDPTTPTTATSVQSSKPKKSSKAAVDSKKPRTKSLHPPTSEMVNNAIKTLKERNGSSLQAIKKYISVNYKIDSDKLSPFIKKYLKSGVANLQLIQTKGKGASGSFKLATVAKLKPLKSDKSVSSVKSDKSKASKKPVPKKSTTVGKATASAKKSKAAASDKKKIVKSSAKAVKKSGGSVKAIPKQKPTKATKNDIKKIKTPKPKKTSAVAAPKKVVSKK